ncbi:hypothetical protein Hanom_Chr01g00057961 [Helianthus anomalus]
MLWLKEHGNASVAKSVLNSEELDKRLRICWLLHRMMVMLKVMDLITVALQSEDHVAQLKEIFPDREEDGNEDLA